MTVKYATGKGIAVEFAGEDIRTIVHHPPHGAPLTPPSNELRKLSGAELRPLDSRETLEAVNRVADYLEGWAHNAGSDIEDDERQEPVEVTMAASEGFHLIFQNVVEMPLPPTAFPALEPATTPPPPPSEPTWEDLAQRSAAELGEVLSTSHERSKSTLLD